MSGAARVRRARVVFLVSVAGAIGALAVFGGTAASAPVQTTEVRVVTLPIANGFPLDIGIRRGFFAQQGIEIKKTTLQSGNDVVLAMANNNGDIGYLGFVPMFIAVTNNIQMTLVAASEVEGVGQADNWQNILVKGSSSIRTSRDLAGKTIAVNALKGVGEVMIKAALEKQGVRPSSFRLVAIPFPQMRSALNNGQVDAIWVPEPFLSQGLNVDNARIVMAPGPVLGRYWPIGGYAARQSWKSRNPALAERFRKAINRSLNYAQSHPDEVRAMLPANAQNSQAPDLEPGDRPGQAEPARRLCEEVRRDHSNAEPPAARAEQHRERAGAPGHRAAQTCAAAARGTVGDAADRRPVHVRRDRQLARTGTSSSRGRASTGARASAGAAAPRGRSTCGEGPTGTGLPRARARRRASASRSSVSGEGAFAASSPPQGANVSVGAITTSRSSGCSR